MPWQLLVLASPALPAVLSSLTCSCRALCDLSLPGVLQPSCEFPCSSTLARYLRRILQVRGGRHAATVNAKSLSFPRNKLLNTLG